MDTETYICKLPSNSASTNTQELFTSFLQTNKNDPPWVIGGGGTFPDLNWPRHEADRSTLSGTQVT